MNKKLDKMLKKYDIDLDKEYFTLNELKKGIKHEANEHRDVLKGNYEKAFLTTLAHLDELPDYYERLFKMVAEGKKYWKSKLKGGDILNDTTN